MQEERKKSSRPLSEKDKDLIIRTTYGAKKIPPCFGFMKVIDPYTVPSMEYTTPNEMEEVRREYIGLIKELVSQVEKCERCHLFDKCTRVTEVMNKVG